MANPNTTKGKASKLEALMKYPENNKDKHKIDNKCDTNYCEAKDNICKLPEITDNNIELFQEVDDKPKMQDFINLIEDSKIIDNKEQRTQYTNVVLDGVFHKIE